MIYLFGPDGAGKTTHANLLVKYLRGRGLSAYRGYVKYHHTLAYVLLRLLTRAGVADSRTAYYGFESNLKERLRIPWKVLELISIFPAVVYRVLIPYVLYDVVVCDRYVVDTLVATSYFLGEPSLLCGSVAKVLLSLIPSNSLLIHLDADEAALILRKRDEPLSADIVRYYKKAYDELEGHLGQTVRIETTKCDVGETQQFLRVLVDKWLDRS